MIEGEKEEKRERQEGREREIKQNNVVEQLHFHFKKCSDSGGPAGGNT